MIVIEIIKTIPIQVLGALSVGISAYIMKRRIEEGKAIILPFIARNIETIGLFFAMIFGMELALMEMAGI